MVPHTGIRGVNMGGGLLGPPGLKKICFLWGFQDPAGAVHPPFEKYARQRLVRPDSWYNVSPHARVGDIFFILEIVMNFRRQLKNFRSLAYSYSIVGYRDKDKGQSRA